MCISHNWSVLWGCMELVTRTLRAKGKGVQKRKKRRAFSLIVDGMDQKVTQTILGINDCNTV